MSGQRAPRKPKVSEPLDRLRTERAARFVEDGSGITITRPSLDTLAREPTKPDAGSTNGNEAGPTYR